MADPELGVNVSPDDSGVASSEKIEAREGFSSAKPKRIRRVEEPMYLSMILGLFLAFGEPLKTTDLSDMLLQ
jgi:hypothetical protein